MKSGMVWRGRFLRYSVLSFLLILGLVFPVATQVLAQTPYAQSSIGTGSGLDLVPSNPVAMPGSTGRLPGGSDSILLSTALLEGVLPPIANLEIGYLENFGNRARSSRFTLDYVPPVALSDDSVLFGDARWLDMV